jgi:enamine deaminase RidA (YjgF/YER057c/UK114 family)
MDIHAKLAELGLKLPVLGKPVAAYIPAVRSGNLLMVSGQVCMKDGKLQMAGRVPSQVSPEDAFRAAETCALNAVAAIDQGLDGDWSKFRRIVRAGVYVYSDPEFGQQHIVANGASELLAKIFGEAGRHARTAIGVAALPLGAPVEVDLMVEVA